MARTAAAQGGPGLGLVVPIPWTLNLFGEEFHVQAPPLTGPDTDPSGVYNLRGAAGIAFISGSCERTDRKTGETQTLPSSTTCASCRATSKAGTATLAFT